MAGESQFGLIAAVWELASSQEKARYNKTGRDQWSSLDQKGPVWPGCLAGAMTVSMSTSKGSGLLPARQWYLCCDGADFESLSCGLPPRVVSHQPRLGTARVVGMPVAGWHGGLQVIGGREAGTLQVCCSPFGGVVRCSRGWCFHRRTLGGQQLGRRLGGLFR